MGVHERAGTILRLCNPAAKCEQVLDLVSDWWAGRLSVDPQDPAPLRVPVPGRPERPLLVAPRELPRRHLGDEAGRIALIHAVAHIEFNAINLALDAIYRFRMMAQPFISDWLQVAAEEVRHFRLLQGRLRELGSDYGDCFAHDGLWEAAQDTDHDCLVRMALVPRVLEARGLDVTPGMIQRLLDAGDARTAGILGIIQREEVAHVRIGTRWFRVLAQERGRHPDQLFIELLTQHRHGVLRPPFATAARRAAGFSVQELRELEQLATRGRNEASKGQSSARVQER